MTTQHIELMGPLEQAEAGHGIITLLQRIFGDDPQALAWPSLLIALGDGLASLGVAERRVLFLRYGLQDGKKRTLKAVSLMLGVTPERIRQIEAKALRKLRHPNTSSKLREAMLFGDSIPVEGFNRAVDALTYKLDKLNRLFGLTLEQVNEDALIRAAERLKTQQTISEQIEHLRVAGVKAAFVNPLRRSPLTKPLEQCTDKELLGLRHFGAGALKEVRRYYPAQTEEEPLQKCEILRQARRISTVLDQHKLGSDSNFIIKE